MFVSEGRCTFGCRRWFVFQCKNIGAGVAVCSSVGADFAVSVGRVYV